MNKEVLISLKGGQSDGDEREEIELVTKGKFYKKGGKYYVTYKETEVTGLEGTTTTLKIEKDKVTLLRYGQNNSQLIFEKGQHHLCCYETDFGSFLIGVRSSKVDINLDDSGGHVLAEYTIEVDNNSSGCNDFHLQIREC